MSVTCTCKLNGVCTNDTLPGNDVCTDCYQSVHSFAYRVRVTRSLYFVKIQSTADYPLLEDKRWQSFTLDPGTARELARELDRMADIVEEEQKEMRRKINERRLCD